ncbi:uncharacterized protein LOC116349749 isoform X2 [Contarinia nasturtii]|uniref:uncharacterized protein LOC116349749 isoform X2 n=1 Tax=Contarinia nasturtii TaxID=265458 RepID=UPI0012D45F5D|nr:uncharacterized protein LOC116349749 isoform X2 [Contarinia nasturtii]
MKKYSKRDMLKWRNELRLLVNELLEGIEGKKDAGFKKDIKHLTVKRIKTTIPRSIKETSGQNIKLPELKNYNSKSKDINQKILYLDRLEHKLPKCIKTTKDTLDNKFVQYLCEESKQIIDETFEVFPKNDPKLTETSGESDLNTSGKRKFVGEHKVTKKLKGGIHGKPAYTSTLMKPSTSGGNGEQSVGNPNEETSALLHQFLSAAITVVREFGAQFVNQTIEKVLNVEVGRERGTSQNTEEMSTESAGRATEASQNIGERATEATGCQQEANQNIGERSMEPSGCEQQANQNNDDKTTEPAYREQETSQNTGERLKEATCREQETMINQNDNSNAANSVLAANSTECIVEETNHAPKLITSEEAESAGILFYCYFCKQNGESIRFHSEQSLRRHCEKRHKLLPFSYYAFEKAKCLNCDYVGTWRELNSHHQKVHPKEIFSIVSHSDDTKCALCSYTGNASNIHSKMRHPLATRSSVFNPLRISSENLRKLRAQITLANRNEFFFHQTKGFSCQKCKTFRSEEFIELLMHEREVHGPFDYDKYQRKFKKRLQKKILNSEVHFPNGLTLFGRNLIGSDIDLLKNFDINFFDHWKNTVKYKFDQIQNYTNENNAVGIEFEFNSE